MPCTWIPNIEPRRVGEYLPYRLADESIAFLEEHRDVTRRYFLKLGTVGMAGLAASPLWAQDAEGDRLLAEAVAQLEYLTPETKFAGGGRGNPPPFKLTPEERREAGLDPETWQLEVIADPTSTPSSTAEITPVRSFPAAQ